MLHSILVGLRSLFYRTIKFILVNWHECNLCGNNLKDELTFDLPFRHSMSFRVILGQRSPFRAFTYPEAFVFHQFFIAMHPQSVTHSCCCKNLFISVYNSLSYQRRYKFPLRKIQPTTQSYYYQDFGMLLLKRSSMTEDWKAYRHRRFSWPRHKSSHWWIPLTPL